LIYFGYTFCPDICPLALQTMTQALEMAGPVAEDVLPIFITIDPARDTAAVIGAYVAHFHPKFLGLTGTPEQVRAAEKSYAVYAAKSATSGPNEKAGGDYVMDHTGRIYLMDRNGANVAYFGKDATAAEIANRLRRELNPR
jgi:protein SCO1/2